MSLRTVLILGTALLLSSAAHAQWTSDATLNTVIAGGSTDQLLPKVAPTADGGCYVSWYAAAAGPAYWNVRLNRLDASGAALWGPDGILVSDKANPAPAGSAVLGATVDYDLKVDSSGNALIVLTDTRLNTARDVFAYRVSPAGVHEWSAEGRTLSNNSNFEKDPRIVQTSDGNYAVVWARTGSGSVAGRGIMMQRLDSSGLPQLADGGVLVAGSGVGGVGSNEVADLAEVVASDAGSIVIVYVRDTRTVTSPRHLYAQKIGPDASRLWNSGSPVVVSDQPLPAPPVTTPRPSVVSDGSGGVVAAWHDLRAGVGQYNVWVQRVLGDGSVAYIANGVQASMDASSAHQDASVSFDPATGSATAFWRESDLALTTFGVSGQSFGSAGARLWGDSGLALKPIGPQNILLVRSARQHANTTVVCVSEPGGAGSDVLLGWSVNAAGATAWTPAQLTFASTPSGKTVVPVGNLSTVRLPVAILSSGAAVVAWEDARSGNFDVMAQRINANGSLGIPVCTADFNGQGGVTVQDIFDFLAAWFVGNAAADINGSGSVTVQDIFDFLAAWFAGC